jgi:hypothetical protein
MNPSIFNLSFLQLNLRAGKGNLKDIDTLWPGIICLQLAQVNTISREDDQAIFSSSFTKPLSSALNSSLPQLTLQGTIFYPRRKPMSYGPEASI